MGTVLRVLRVCVVGFAVLLAPWRAEAGASGCGGHGLVEHAGSGVATAQAESGLSFASPASSASLASFLASFARAAPADRAHAGHGDGERLAGFDPARAVALQPGHQQGRPDQPGRSDQDGLSGQQGLSDRQGVPDHQGFTHHQDSAHHPGQAACCGADGCRMSCHAPGLPVLAAVVLPPAGRAAREGRAQPDPKALDLDVDVPPPRDRD